MLQDLVHEKFGWKWKTLEGKFQVYRGEEYKF